MNRLFPIILVFVVLGCASTTNVVAEDVLTEEKKADITKLMDVTGALDVGMQFSEFLNHQMAEILKKNRPDIPPEMFNIFKEEVNKTIKENLNDFKSQMVPIYHKYLTHKEIKELLAFYQTDLGKKTIAVMPLVMRESMETGLKWGQKLGPQIRKRVIERFKEKGIDISSEI